jgi:AraC-like DNA-binding protein
MLESRTFRRLTIAEISRRSGFGDPSHFARVMKSRSGHTPLQIRRNARD